MAELTSIAQPKGKATQAAAHVQRKASGPAPTAAMPGKSELSFMDQVTGGAIAPPVQAKLTVGPPNDAFEAEADHTAEKIMRMPGPEKPIATTTSPSIQRKCSSCDDKDSVQRKSLRDAAPVIRRMRPSDSILTKRKQEDDDLTIQRKSDTGERGPPSGFSTQLDQTKGRGDPMDTGTQTFMESRFGADFSNVRIHTGGTAAGLNSAINARAFTHGSNIYFNSGEYQPRSQEGKSLLAHELTHTIQQGAVEQGGMVQAKLFSGGSGVIQRQIDFEQNNALDQGGTPSGLKFSVIEHDGKAKRHEQKIPDKEISSEELINSSLCTNISIPEFSEGIVFLSERIDITIFEGMIGPIPVNLSAILGANIQGSAISSPTDIKVCAEGRNKLSASVDYYEARLDATADLSGSLYAGATKKLLGIQGDLSVRGGAHASFSLSNLKGSAEKKESAYEFKLTGNGELGAGLIVDLIAALSLMFLGRKRLRKQYELYKWSWDKALPFEFHLDGAFNTTTNRFSPALGLKIPKTGLTTILKDSFKAAYQQSKSFAYDSSETQSMESDEAKLPETKVEWGSLSGGGFGTSMEADPLTLNSGNNNGSPPGVTNETWKVLVMRQTRSKNGRSWYARGHLLNHNLHGTGMDWKNLAPITQTSNGRHLREIETPIKNAVRSKKVVTYSVNAKEMAGLNQSLIEKINRAEIPEEIKEKKRKIVEAEQHVPLRFDCVYTIFPSPEDYYNNTNGELKEPPSIKTFDEATEPSDIIVAGEDDITSEPTSTQPYLKTGSVDTPLEREADATADRIMRMPTGNTLQRKCTSCEAKEHIQWQPIPTSIQRMVSGESGGVSVNHDFEQGLNATKGGGKPMDKGTRAFMESRFGADFGGVRIHTGGTAAKLNEQIQAKAFTKGNDIYFNHGQYNPESDSGKRLLAHELTHTVQQGASGNQTIQREPVSVSQDVSNEDLLKAIRKVRLELATNFQGAILYAAAQKAQLDLSTVSSGGFFDISSAVRYQRSLAVLTILERKAEERKILPSFTDHLAALSNQKGPDPGEVRGLIENLIAQFGLESATTIVKKGYTQSEHISLEHKVQLYLQLDLLTSEANGFIDQVENEGAAILNLLLDNSQTTIDEARRQLGISVTKKASYKSWFGSGFITHVSKSEVSLNPENPTSQTAMNQLRSKAEELMPILERALQARDSYIEKAQEVTNKYTHRCSGGVKRGCDGPPAVWPLKDSDPDVQEMKKKEAISIETEKLYKTGLTDKAKEALVLPMVADRGKFSESAYDDLKDLKEGNTGLGDVSDQLNDIEKNIYETRFRVLQRSDSDYKVWRLPNVMQLARTNLLVRDGSMQDRLIRDKVEDEKPGWLGLLIAGILLAVASFGLGAFVEAAWAATTLLLVEAANVALNLYTAGLALKEFSTQKILSNTALTLADSIVKDEPSMGMLLWNLALSGLDSATRVLRIKELTALKNPQLLPPPTGSKLSGNADISYLHANNNKMQVVTPSSGQTGRVHGNLALAAPEPQLLPIPLVEKPVALPHIFNWPAANDNLMSPLIPKGSLFTPAVPANTIAIATQNLPSQKEKEDDRKKDDDCSKPEDIVEHEVTAAKAHQLPQITGLINISKYDPIDHRITLPSGDSDVVGTSMETEYLVNPKKGSAPWSQNHIYGLGKLPTLKALGGKDFDNDMVFIKGHLLNEHLGGPGKAKNLYPITGDANKLHNTRIEEPLKTLAKQYLTYYIVEVSNRTAPVEMKVFENGKCSYYYVNSTLNCTYGTYKLCRSGRLVRNPPKPSAPISSVFNVDGFMNLVKERKCPENPGFQPKLKVGPVNDPFEREADATADRVMRMPVADTLQRKCSSCEEKENTIQRKCSACEKENTIQRNPKAFGCASCEDKEHIHRKPLSTSIQRMVSGESGGVSVDHDPIAIGFEQQLNTTKGRGHPVDKATRSFMESRFGADFSKVRIHTGTVAANLCDQIRARAFTRGNDIYFNHGEYQPDTEEGKHLLAHELTHTIQQTGAQPTIQREPEKTGATDSEIHLSERDSDDGLLKKLKAVHTTLANNPLGAAEYKVYNQYGIPFAPGTAGYRYKQAMIALAELERQAAERALLSQTSKNDWFDYAPSAGSDKGEIREYIQGVILEWGLDEGVDLIEGVADASSEGLKKDISDQLQIAIDEAEGFIAEVELEGRAVINTMLNDSQATIDAARKELGIRLINGPQVKTYWNGISEFEEAEVEHEDTDPVSTKALESIRQHAAAIVPDLRAALDAKEKLDEYCLSFADNSVTLPSVCTMDTYVGSPGTELEFAL